MYLSNRKKIAGDGMYLLNFLTKVLLFWQNNWIVLPLNMTSLQSHTCAHFSAVNLRQKLHYHINTFRTSWTHLCKNIQTFVKLFIILCGYAFCILLIFQYFSLGIKWAQTESTLTVLCFEMADLLSMYGERISD